MTNGGEALRVGVHWDELAHQPAQVQRIAQASGAEPIIWDGSDPAPDVDVLISAELPQSIPEQTPHLRLVQTVSAGVEWLPDHPIWRSEVILAKNAGVHAVQIAELAFAMLLALTRDLRRYEQAQQRHEWLENTPPHRELYGLTLGLIGYGHLGHGMAHLARAFGMRVLAMSASVDERRPLEIAGVAPFVAPPAYPAPTLGADELLPPAAFDDLLAQSDVLVVCAALTPRTHGLIDAAALARLKPGAYLINVARGKIVDEGALVQALREGRLAGAGLDVTEEEPLRGDSPLWDLPNVILTPHIAGGSDHNVERTVNVLLANIDCLRRGEPPLTVVQRGRGY